MNVKQVEADRAAVADAVEDNEHLPHAYDNIEQQVDDTREVAGELADVGGKHSGRVLDAPLAAGKRQAAKQKSKQGVYIDPGLEYLSLPGGAEQSQNAHHDGE